MIETVASFVNAHPRKKRVGASGRPCNFRFKDRAALVRKEPGREMTFAGCALNFRKHARQVARRSRLNHAQRRDEKLTEWRAGARFRGLEKNRSRRLLDQRIDFRGKRMPEFHG